MNKKGIAFIPLMALFTFLLAVGMLVISSDIKPIANDKNWIGNVQNNVLGGYSDVIHFRYNLNTAVEQAIKIALYEMGTNGGLADCSKKAGEFVLWSDCKPHNFDDNFVTYFKNNLKKELPYEYNLEIINKNPLIVKGTAKEKIPLTHQLYSKVRDAHPVDVTYYLDPSFTYAFNYDLSQYYTLETKINEKFNCFRKTLDPNQCISGLNAKKEGSIVSFTISGNKEVVYKDDKYVLEPINIMFANDFSKSLLQAQESLL